MSRNFDSTNPKKNRLMRRTRPSYGFNNFGRYARDDGATLVRVSPFKSRSIYTPQVQEAQE